jgi:hypothetical protein
MAVMLELSPYAPLFLAIAVTELLLGLYVLSRGRGSPAARPFLGFAVLASGMSVLGILMASPISFQNASLFDKVFWFLLGLEMGLGYRLSRLLHIEPRPAHLGRGRRSYVLLVLGIALLLSATAGAVQQDRYGWFSTSNLPLTASAMLLYVMLIVIGVRRKVAVKDDRRGTTRTALLSLALAFPMLILLPMMVLGHLDLPVPRIYGLGELVPVSLIGYGILRYGLSIPPRVSERATFPEGNLPALQRGRTYLFEGQDPDLMFRCVQHEVGQGLSALIICRTHPDQLRARYRLSHTPMIWLAESPGLERVDPGNLQMLYHMILEFVRGGPSLVAVEGLEYLMVNNELNKVLRFIGQLRDHIIVEGNMLMVAVDPRTLTERQKAILERELEHVVEK